jgi:hypothetical protein
MTEATTPTQPEPIVSGAPSWPVGHPLYAPPLDQATAAAVLERLETTMRESREKSARIDAAWRSPEGLRIRDIVREDGNVEWPEFVKHCGGILEVVGMVDEYGLPDTDRIIPKVDELFDKYVKAEIDRGSIFRRRPGNRPYVAGRGTAAGEARAAAKRAEFPGDREPREGDTEALLRAEQEEAAARSRTTHWR